MKIDVKQSIVDGRLQIEIGLQTRDWKEQPRVPAGNPDGGEWGPAGGSWSGGEGGSSGGWTKPEGASAKPGGASAGQEAPKQQEAPKKESFRDRQKKWETELSDSQSGAIRKFTGSDYKAIRNCQNNGKCSDKSRKLIKDMNSALENAPDYEGEVYRGINLSKQAFNKMVATMSKSRVMEDKGFTSASRSRSIAETFAMGEGRGGSSVKVILKIKTKRGVSVERLSDHVDEQEVLLRPGSKLHIVEGKMNRMGYFEMEAVEI